MLHLVEVQGSFMNKICLGEMTPCRVSKSKLIQGEKLNDQQSASETAGPLTSGKGAGTSWCWAKEVLGPPAVKTCLRDIDCQPLVGSTDHKVLRSVNKLDLICENLDLAHIFQIQFLPD